MPPLKPKTSEQEQSFPDLASDVANLLMFELSKTDLMRRFFYRNKWRRSRC